MAADAFKYSASFKLYDPDGLQVYFHVGGNEQEPHVADTLAYLARLKNLGLSANPPGETPGALIESIDAYVVGETSKGDACVYLYSSDHRLKFKYATVYVERFSELPFTPTGQVWPGSAPVRDDAERKKYLVDVPEFDIVLEPQFNNDGTPRLTEQGRPIYEFARVKTTLPAAEPVPTPSGVQTGAAGVVNGSTTKNTGKGATVVAGAEPPAGGAQASGNAVSGVPSADWTTEQAEAWAVNMGAYPTAAAAKAALTALWKAEGKPEKPALWKAWSSHVSLKLDEIAAAKDKAPAPKGKVLS